MPLDAINSDSVAWRRLEQGLARGSVVQRLAQVARARAVHACR
jgi:hypothetical protein